MKNKIDFRGMTPETWDCVDCGINTAPGFPSRVQLEKAFCGPIAERGSTCTYDDATEVYMVKDAIWKAAGMNAGQGGFGDQDGDSGCLCIGCLEKRLGRTLRAKDFPRNHPFNSNACPGTERLLARRRRPGPDPWGVMAEMEEAASAELH